MKFNEIISSIISKQKTEQPLSRIYGYQRDKTGKIHIVTDEAKTIKTVIETLASSKSQSTISILDDLLQQLFLDNIRNRSGKRWTRQSLLGLVRPVYGGVIVSKMGVWRKSRIYPAIVEPSLVKAALRRLNSHNVS